MDLPLMQIKIPKAALKLLSESNEVISQLRDELERERQFNQEIKEALNWYKIRNFDSARTLKLWVLNKDDALQVTSLQPGDVLWVGRK